MTDPQQRPGRGMTFAFAGSVALLGILLVTSAQSPAPPEARLHHRIELVELIQQEEHRAQTLQARIEALSQELAHLEEILAADADEVAELRSVAASLAAPAGLTAVGGPGLTVTLDDAGRQAIPSDGNLNDYVIHEEDLQAVINGLWAGGAEAVAVNGHRIIATTAIRCVGNVLLLHGTTHSPPYRIEAIGDPDALADVLASDPSVARFADAAREFKLGFDVRQADELRLAAYEGHVALQRARPQDPARG